MPVAIRVQPRQGWGLATADEPPRPGTTLEELADAARPRSARTAGSPPATPPGSTTAPPPRCSPPRTSRDELGLPVRMRLVVVRLRRRRARGDGRRPGARRPRRRSRKAGLTIDDIGLFEINEAFAVQVLAFLDHYGIADDDARVNQYGGAIAVGHPLASSGVRLMTQLARQFEEQPRRPLRPDHDVRRPRHGRDGHLGEPALSTRTRRSDRQHRAA